MKKLIALATTAAAAVSLSAALSLPSHAQSVADGSPEHPLRVLLIPADGGTESGTKADYAPVFNAITRTTGLNFDLKVGQSYGAVVEGMCNQLADIAPEHRGARFVCAAALVTPDGFEHVETGTLEGTLALAPRGSHGFGYDPILVPLGDTRSCAELTPDEKNAISHRGTAFRALVPTLVRVLGG